MTTFDADPIVAEYLHRLDAASAALPPDRRRELLDEIAEHIDAARRSGVAEGEAAMRELLDRLGEPDEIVAAAWDGEPPTSGAAGQRWAQRRPGIGRELAAVLLLTVGSVVPVAGWLAGVVLVWLSRRWRTWEKVLATVVVPGGPFLALFAGALLPTRTCTGFADSNGTVTSTCSGTALPGWAVIALLVFWVAGPIAVGVVLLRAAHRRASAEPADWVPVQAATGRWGPLEVAAVALLSVGAFVLPVVGPAAGLVCAWLSPAWTTAQKRVATALASVAIVLPVLLLVGLFVASF